MRRAPLHAAMQNARQTGENLVALRSVSGGFGVAQRGSSNPTCQADKPDQAGAGMGNTMGKSAVHALLWQHDGRDGRGDGPRMARIRTLVSAAAEPAARYASRGAAPAQQAAPVVGGAGGGC